MHPKPERAKIDTFVLKQWRVIRGTFRHLLSRRDIRDVLQEAAARYLVEYDRDEAGTREKPINRHDCYVRKVLESVAFDVLRENTRDLELPRTMRSRCRPRPEDPDPATLADNSDIMEIAHDVLSRSSPITQRIFTEYFAGQLTLREVAKIAAVSHTTVRNTILLVLKQIRARFNDLIEERAMASMNAASFVEVKPKRKSR